SSSLSLNCQGGLRIQVKKIDSALSSLKDQAQQKSQRGSRGLRGVVLAVSDDHAGLKRSIAEILPEAFWQRCYVHFLRNALDYLPGKAADDRVGSIPRGGAQGRAQRMDAARGDWTLEFSRRGDQKSCHVLSNRLRHTLDGLHV